MVGSGGRPAVIDGYVNADVVAYAQASILFRVSRWRDGDVALKVFRFEDGQTLPRSWMLGDWRIWSELVHPHVLPVSDFGERDDALYVATPWVDGPSLRAVLDRRRILDPAEVRVLAGQLAGALDAAASAGLVHLDVKPENVLFAAADSTIHAYVTDFGAGALAARRMGTSGSFRGTFAYAAPEQVDGGPVDGRAAVYALGCLLHETLTGTTGRSQTEALAPGLDRVFARALARRPEERYATCTELAEALSAPLALLQAPRPAGRTRRRVVGLRQVTVVASVALVLSAGATAASWLTSGAPSAPPPAPNAAANPAFLAALPKGQPTAKHHVVRTTTHAAAPVNDPPASKVQHHDVARTVAPPGTTTHATATTTPRRAATPPPATTTSTASVTTTPLPPPPPPAQDSAPPPPPPP